MIALERRPKADLEELGFLVWLDTQEICTGRTWEMEIRDGGSAPRWWSPCSVPTLCASLVLTACVLASGSQDATLRVSNVSSGQQRLS